MKQPKQLPKTVKSSHKVAEIRQENLNEFKPVEAMSGFVLPLLTRNGQVRGVLEISDLGSSDNWIHTHYMAQLTAHLIDPLLNHINQQETKNSIIL